MIQRGDVWWTELEHPRGSAPGNVLIPRRDSGLARDSVANVSQLVTLDRSDLTERVGPLSPELLRQVDRGLRLALDL